MLSKSCILTFVGLLLSACATGRAEPRFATGRWSGAAAQPLHAEAPVAERVRAESAAVEARAPRARANGFDRWATGRAMAQGLFGATMFDKIERSGGTSPSVDGSGRSSSQMPTIGGGAQLKLAGDQIDVGLEALLSLSWRSDGTAVVAGGSGAAVAVDIGVLLVDLYGGPFVSLSLGERARIYGAAGPLMQFADYDQTGPDASNTGSGSGFGLGYYTRAGIEFDIGGTLVGLGARWSQSTVDLSGGQGDLDLDGLQFALTVSHWL